MQRKQEQSGGAGSTNIQAGRDAIVRIGITAVEAREIALDVVRESSITASDAARSGRLAYEQLLAAMLLEAVYEANEQKKAETGSSAGHGPYPLQIILQANESHIAANRPVRFRWESARTDKYRVWPIITGRDNRALGIEILHFSKKVRSLRILETLRQIEEEVELIRREGADFNVLVVSNIAMGRIGVVYTEEFSVFGGNAVVNDRTDLHELVAAIRRTFDDTTRVTQT